MTLPFDQYSLLDQSFISRVQGNVFRFMVPANELVGLQTVPIVDVKVDVDAKKRLLAITSISSRLVSRASDGTILGTHDVGLLSNNSLSFSTTISWAEGGGLGSGLRPGANLARLRQRIFQPKASAATNQKGTSGMSGMAASLLDDNVASSVQLQMDDIIRGGSREVEDNSLRIQSRAAKNNEGEEGPAAAAAAANSKGGNVKKRKLACTAKIDVGVVVPPPFSLVPTLVLRRGASIVLSTLVASLINRFLDLVIEDFYKWEQGVGRNEGSLLGYEPERYADRIIETDTDGDNLIKELQGEIDQQEEDPPPEYII